MFDAIGFIQQFGWLATICVVTASVLLWFLYRDAKAASKKLQVAFKRIKILEDSIRHEEKVLCRSDCIRRLDSIESILREFVK